MRQNISIPSEKEARLIRVAAKVWAKRAGVPAGAALSRFAREAMREKIQRDGLLNREKKDGGR